MDRRTRIVATVGPSSASLKVLQKLYDKGADVFRLNMSHGDRAGHAAVVERIRRIRTQPGCEPAILVDLQGPKIRVGDLSSPMRLKVRTEILLAARVSPGPAPVIPVGGLHPFRDVKKGHRILLDDGKIELRVTNVRQKAIACRVRRGGILTSRKGINLPDCRVRAPALTAKDRDNALFAIEQGADYLALSFVRTPGDVRALRNLLRKRKSDIRIIAKIEKPEATAHLQAIVDLSDGLLVARGDLGVEMSTQKVPVLQKRIIAMANRAGKLVITATQMLETMMENPFPTRAEASDVAHAIFDGSDAVMLSGETAAGKYPVEAVQTMRAIAAEAECSAFQYRTSGDLDAKTGYLPHAVAEAAFHVAGEIPHSALVVFTLSGSTAVYLSKLRPCVPVLAMSPDPAICRRLSLAWGVRALLTPFGRNTDEMVAKGEQVLIRSGLAKKGQQIIVIAGAAPTRGGTNIIKIHRLGQTGPQPVG